jgi:oligopeptide transport system substrate-binding protein
MTIRRQLFAIAAVLSMGIASGAVAPMPAQAETILNRGFGASPHTLDPHVIFGLREWWIQDDLYEGLVATAADGKVIPGAAESWDISDDGRTITFHLRPNLKWSNGEPLVAQDFINGILRTLDAKTASEKGYYFYNVIQITNTKGYAEGTVTDPAQVGLKAPDDKTVVISLDNPAPHVFFVLNSFQTTPLHTPSFEKFGEKFVEPGNQVGNGAYVLKENVPQSHVLLEKNPNYWDAANVKIDKVRYVVTEDVNTELKRYQAGEIDTTNEIPSDQREALKAELGGEVREMISTETMSISFNVTKPPFDNVRVRQALSMAIDREALQDKVLKAGYKASYSYVPAVDPTYDGPKIAEAGMSKEEREEKARALLAEAGFGPDNPLKLGLLSTTDETEKREASAIAIMWKQVLGVQADLQNQEFQAWLDTFYAGNWDVFNDNLVGDFPGPETYLVYMKPSSEAGYNWKNDEYENLMNKAATVADPTERLKILAQAEKILLDDYLTAPIASATSRHLVKPYVKGWVDNVVESHPSRFMSIEQ